MPSNDLAQKAADFYILSARDGKSRLAVETSVGDTYIQHNHRVPDGPEGFRKRYHDMSHDYGYRDVAVIRSFASDTVAALHTIEDRGDGGVWVAMVLLRFADGKICEQWDNFVEVEDLASALAVTGGPSTISTLEATDHTSAKAQAVIQALIDNEPMSAAAVFDHRKFRHHDAGHAQRTFPAEWFDNRSNLRVDTIHQVVAQHNFAVVQSEGSVDGTATAFTDWFRCEQGLIIQHWGIAESIVDESASEHRNGKF